MARYLGGELHVQAVGSLSGATAVEHRHGLEVEEEQALVLGMATTCWSGGGGGGGGGGRRNKGRGRRGEMKGMEEGKDDGI